MPALALQIEPQTQAPWITSVLSSVYGRSCGRWKYCKFFQLDCVPRKVFQSSSTSRPSAAKKPSRMATKSLSPMPLGAIFTRCSSLAMTHPPGSDVSRSLSPPPLAGEEISRRAQPAFVLDEAGDLVDALAGAQVAEDERPRPAHAFGVALHVVQRGADVGGEVDLVDHQEVRTGDARSAFGGDFLAGRD